MHDFVAIDFGTDFAEYRTVYPDYMSHCPRTA